jgi:hypothetical protein
MVLMALGLMAGAAATRLFSHADAPVPSEP